MCKFLAVWVISNSIQFAMLINSHIKSSNILNRQHTYHEIGWVTYVII